MIAIISIVLSVIALKDLENKSHEKQVKKRLRKGRVIFRR